MPWCDKYSQNVDKQSATQSGGKNLAALSPLTSVKEPEMGWPKNREKLWLHYVCIIVVWSTMTINTHEAYIGNWTIKDYLGTVVKEILAEKKTFSEM